MPTRENINTHDIFADTSERRQKGLLTNTGLVDCDLDRAMTEKTEGGEREEAGAARREVTTNPRTYSDFMRNLAAKYNTETSPE